MDWLLFLTKKTISLALYPLGASLLMWALGTLVWLRRPRSRAGVLLMWVGGLWLLAMSLPVTGFYLLHSLEARAGGYADPGKLASDGVKYIVVLGGDLRPGKLTAADRIANTSLVRLMEAIRLWKSLPDGKLVLSGGRYSPKIMTTGDGMAELAREMGVPHDAILVERESLDTDDEAQLLKPLLGVHPFALVTTACHMPRSLMLFRGKGLNPIPAPADFETKEFVFELVGILPRMSGLDKSHKATHEYLGICVLMMKQYVSR
jgi:uncharacterized SAM-binding protein YcdF (DUF218 family)